MAIKDYFQLLFPFLLITWIIFSVGSWTKVLQPGKGLHRLLGLALSAVFALVPFTGLSLAEYLLSFNPNFSIGSLALVLMGLYPWFSGKPLLSDRHLFWFCLWNVALSLALYGSYLGLVTADMYAGGYGFSLWFAVMALLTMILVWRGNPLSYIFVAYIAAFNLQVLPSPNFFDYITDGFLLVSSLGLAAYYPLKHTRLRALPTPLFAMLSEVKHLKNMRSFGRCAPSE